MIYNPFRSQPRLYCTPFFRCMPKQSKKVNFFVFFYQNTIMLSSCERKYDMCFRSNQSISTKIKDLNHPGLSGSELTLSSAFSSSQLLNQIPSLPFLRCLVSAQNVVAQLKKLVISIVSTH